MGWKAGAAALAGRLAAGSLALVGAVTVWGERPFGLLLRPLTLLPFFGEERLARAALKLVGGLAAIRRPRLMVTALF